MGRKIETVRKHARLNMAAALNHSLSIATRPADLTEAFRMTQRSAAIRAAYDAGLIPESMLEVAAMLDAGSEGIRRLAELQDLRKLMARRGVDLTEAYCTERQLSSLDEGFLGWRQHA